MTSAPYGRTVKFKTCAGITEIRKAKCQLSDNYTAGVYRKLHKMALRKITVTNKRQKHIQMSPNAYSKTRLSVCNHFHFQPVVILPLMCVHITASC